MKKLLTISILALGVIALLSTGCTKNNIINYDHVVQELTLGITEYYGSLDGASTTNFDLWIYSSGLNYTESLDFIRFSGIGSALSLQMYSPDDAELAVGTYTFDSNSSMNQFTFDAGKVYMDYNMLRETGTFFEITGGDIEVEKKNDKYTITLTLITDNSSQLKTVFKGEIKAYDRSAEVMEMDKRTLTSAKKHLNYTSY